MAKFPNFPPGSRFDPKRWKWLGGYSWCTGDLFSSAWSQERFVEYHCRSCKAHSNTVIVVFLLCWAFSFSAKHLTSLLSVLNLCRGVLSVLPISFSSLLGAGHSRQWRKLYSGEKKSARQRRETTQQGKCSVEKKKLRSGAGVCAYTQEHCTCGPRNHNEPNGVIVFEFYMCTGWFGRVSEWYQSLTAHQYQKGHTVPKQV